MAMEREIELKTLNCHITCKICHGYLIDPTTVTHCLHPFCKCCLVKHCEKTNTCPTCQIVINQSHPLQYINTDRSMKESDYKLVTELQDKEIKHERDFYSIHGFLSPKDSPPNASEMEKEKSTSDTRAESDYHRQDEQMNVRLECISNNLKPLEKSFIRCSAQTTITHLKRLIAKKVLSDIEKYIDIDILCNNELLRNDHTLKFVYDTRWRSQNPPLRLQYKPRRDM